jgi:hypothetical protein
MTEADWLACAEPLRLLEVPAVQTNARKLRMFACAYWLRLAGRLKDERCRDEVAVARRFADGLASEEELTAAHASVRAFMQALTPHFTVTGNPASPQAAIHGDINPVDGWQLARAALASTETEARRAAISAIVTAPWFGTKNAADPGASSTSESTAPATFMDTLGKLWVSVKTVGASLLSRGPEHRAQADLLRHIFGNPFHPVAASEPWPSAVHRLAASLYEGSECAFALHDALLDAGYNDLADHFREPEHPTSCWALDVILARS